MRSMIPISVATKVKGREADLPVKAKEEGGIPQDEMVKS